MGLRTSLVILILTSLLIGCSSENNKIDLLDYSSIPVSELEPDFTIGESENYLPAQLTRVMVSNDGYILVTQRVEKSIHQFDSLGNYMTQVTGFGRGPGELSQYANNMPIPILVVIYFT